LLQCTDQIEIYSADVFLSLEKFASRKSLFDIIFADPPYDLGYGEKLIQCLDEKPIVTQEGRIFLEESKRVKLDGVACNRLTWVKTRLFGDSSLWEFQTS
jgi:16S rRNA G966 N2-methylase RsmD